MHEDVVDATVVGDGVDFAVRREYAKNGPGRGTRVVVAIDGRRVVNWDNRCRVSGRTAEKVILDMGGWKWDVIAEVAGASQLNGAC